MRSPRARAFAFSLLFPVIVDGRAAGVVYASRTPPHVMQMAYAERDKLAFSGIAMGVLILVFIFVASRAITAPIRRLTERTRSIAAGDRNAMKSLRHHGTAEVAELSEIFPTNSASIARPVR